MLAYADEGSLVTIAAKRFQNLTVAERRLLEIRGCQQTASRRILAGTEYDNAASIAVMRRMGMRIERNPIRFPSGSRSMVYWKGVRGLGAGVRMTRRSSRNAQRRVADHDSSSSNAFAFRSGSVSKPSENQP
jgi:hypothetical protein